MAIQEYGHYLGVKLLTSGRVLSRGARIERLGIDVLIRLWSGPFGSDGSASLPARAIPDGTSV